MYVPGLISIWPFCVYFWQTIGDSGASRSGACEDGEAYIECWTGPPAVRFVVFSKNPTPPIEFGDVASGSSPKTQREINIPEVRYRLSVFMGTASNWATASSSMNSFIEATTTTCFYGTGRWHRPQLPSNLVISWSWKICSFSGRSGSLPLTKGWSWLTIIKHY